MLRGLDVLRWVSRAHRAVRRRALMLVRVDVPSRRVRLDGGVLRRDVARVPDPGVLRGLRLRAGHADSRGLRVRRRQRGHLRGCVFGRDMRRDRLRLHREQRRMRDRDVHRARPCATHVPMLGALRCHRGRGDRHNNGARVAAGRVGAVHAGASREPLRRTRWRVEAADVRGVARHPHGRDRGASANRWVCISRDDEHICVELYGGGGGLRKDRGLRRVLWGHRFAHWVVTPVALRPLDFERDRRWAWPRLPHLT